MEYLGQKTGELREKYKDYLGYIYGLIANFLFAVYDFKLRDTASVPTFQLLFYRSIANLLLVYFYTRSANISLTYKSKENNKTFIVSAMIMTAFAYLSCYGFQRANLSEAIALCQLIPVMATVLGIIFLKEASDSVQSFVTVLSLIGAVLILKPPFIISSSAEVSEDPENSLRALGNLCALASAFCFTISFVISRKMAVQKVEPQVGMFYASFISCIVAALGVMSEGYKSLDASEIINVIWICALSYFAHSLFLNALKYGDAGKVALTTYAEIPIGYAFDVIFFGYAPEFLSALGVIIIFSCLFIQILRDQIFKLFKEKFRRKTNAKMEEKIMEMVKAD